MAAGYVQVPPDSTGKKLHHHTHTIGVNDVLIPAVHLTDHDNPSNVQKVDQRGSASVRFAEGQPTFSGFGGLNVSNKRVLGVYESSSGSYDDLFSILEETGGQNIYDDVAHGTILRVSGASGSHVKRTTNRYHYYLPGSSNIYVMTFAFGDAGKTGNIRRFGCFDDEDGVFFQLENSTLQAVIRSSTSGSVVETKINQADWNIDKVDGTGLSGTTIDITKMNIYWIDYQWLGAGRVRFGMYDEEGNRIVCHQQQHANTAPVAYMRSGTLPFRSENINTASTGSTTELREGCVAIYSEGTHEDFAFWRSSDIDATATCNGSDTLITAIQSRLTPEGLNHHNTSITYPETLNIYSDQPCRIDLNQASTITGGTFVPPSGSAIEHNTSATLTDKGDSFKTWFVPAGVTVIDLKPYFEMSDEGIQRNADDTATIWTITGKKLGATDATVTINLGYRELW